eukprot:gene5040-131_t
MAATKPILPVEGKRNVMVTSALPYVNNVPHLGNIIGCVLSADVFARFSRLRGCNTLFICGTDEYGTATETKAIAEGMTPKEICDKYNAIHKNVYDWFEISFDHFGRTSTEQQTEIAQDIFWKCYNNDYVIQKDEEQWFCVSCDCFLADRFVEGTCPDCGYTDARGDQCDECGHPLHAYQLKNPRCKFRKDCGKTPELRTSTHLYLSLDKLQAKTEQFFCQSCTTGVWSQNAKDITNSWFAKGLEPRAITRDLKWGTPVPLKGFESKVFYVWFDAPIGYISITAEYTKDWDKWWRNPENVELFQFMAKDNVLFHSIIFPSSLLGTGEKWTMVNNLSATEYLNYEDRQFSKSRGVGVFGNNAQESGIPADIYRFYLLYIRPETADTHFDWDDLIAKHNNELLNNLGNFVHRALTFSHKFFDGKLTSITLTEEDKEVVNAINLELESYVHTIEKQVKLRDGLRNLLAISRHGNQLMQANKPWALVKAGDLARAGSVVSLSCNVVALITAMLYPYMPATAENLTRQLNYKPTFIPNSFELVLGEGHAIGEPCTLFSRIDPAMAKTWSQQYGGAQQESKQQSDNQPLEDLPTDKESLERLVAEQGNVVRQAKADGIDKADLNKLVQELRRRKSALAKVTCTSPDDKKDKSKATGGDSENVEKPKKQKKQSKQKQKQEKKQYDGPLADSLKRLGQEVAQQAKVLRDLKLNNASDDDCKAAESRLLGLKGELGAIKDEIRQSISRQNVNEGCIFELQNIGLFYLVSMEVYKQQDNGGLLSLCLLEQGMKTKTIKAISFSPDNTDTCKTTSAKETKLLLEKQNMD